MIFVVRLRCCVLSDCRCHYLLLVLRSFKTREIYSRRFVLSGIGGVKLILSLNECLCSFWVSLKKCC